jgi:hypothetical protein
MMAGPTTAKITWGGGRRQAEPQSSKVVVALFKACTCINDDGRINALDRWVSDLSKFLTNLTPGSTNVCNDCKKSTFVLLILVRCDHV